MTKYKSELKAQIVHEYLSTSQSTNDLSKKYQINGRRIAEWVQGYQLRGINALEKRRRSAPMFFRSQNSHVFSPPAPTKFPNNKTVGYSPTPNKRKALDLASEKQLDNCIRFFPSS